MLPTPQKAYLFDGPVDMRRAIDGLSLLVETLLDRSVTSGEVFVFFNKRGDKCKLRWWDRHGFWLAYKRLEQNRFDWTDIPSGDIQWSNLLLLLEGAPVKTATFQAIQRGNRRANGVKYSHEYGSITQGKSGA
jgi:transposase